MNVFYNLTPCFPALHSAVAVLLLLTTAGQSAVVTDNLQTTATPLLSNASLATELNNSSMDEPLVLKFDTYCLNNGQCMLLVDMNEHHCKYDPVGFYGPRCAHPELVVQRMGDEQIIVTIFCVSLLIIGLAGVLYFCCKWCNEKKVIFKFLLNEKGLSVCAFQL
uniref:Epiregulin n=1 Tax=Seriola dumerili TaxID=41447 RepID=A0A3B4VL27_SERDU